MDIASGARSQPIPPGSSPTRSLYLSVLLKRSVIDAGGQSVGRLADVIVWLRGNDYPVVTGLVADLQGRRVFIPAQAIRSWDTDRLELVSAQVDLRGFERRAGEVLLREDVLGHRVVDVEHARLVRAYDVQLTSTGDGWQVSGLDVHKTGRVPFGRHDRRTIRDWKLLEPLVGHTASIGIRRPFARLRRLKPAEIADLLEEASNEERVDLLAEVHDDRELEADVFEELEEGDQSELFRLQSDAQVAEVLSRMPADAAADAIMELPQERRQKILEMLPPARRTKVMTLLGFHAASAGGLMGVEFLQLPATTTVAEALAAVGQAEEMQPQALTSVYCTDDQGRLCGGLTLVGLLQVDPTAMIGDVADSDPVRVEPSTDLVGLTLLMADHNLLTLPVVDDDSRMIGLITVDDVLEASVPENWRRREPAPRAAHPSAPEGGSS